MAVLVKELEDKERRAAMDKLGVSAYSCCSVSLSLFSQPDDAGLMGLRYAHHAWVEWRLFGLFFMGFLL